MFSMLLHEITYKDKLNVKGFDYFYLYFFCYYPFHHRRRSDWLAMQREGDDTSQGSGRGGNGFYLFRKEKKKVYKEKSKEHSFIMNEGILDIIAGCKKKN